MWQGTIHCWSIQPAQQALGNSGLKKERCARERNACLSTRACLPLVRPFFPAPKYFPATLAMFNTDYSTETMLSTTIVSNRYQSSSWLTRHEFLPHFQRHGAQRNWEDLCCARKKISSLFPRPLHQRLILRAVLAQLLVTSQRENLLAGYIHTS